jgi:hypothetical protein
MIISVVWKKEVYMAGRPDCICGDDRGSLFSSDITGYKPALPNGYRSDDMLIVFIVGM